MLPSPYRQTGLCKKTGLDGSQWLSARPAKAQDWNAKFRQALQPRQVKAFTPADASPAQHPAPGKACTFSQVIGMPVGGRVMDWCLVYRMRLLLLFYTLMTSFLQAPLARYLEMHMNFSFIQPGPRTEQESQRHVEKTKCAMPTASILKLQLLLLHTSNNKTKSRARLLECREARLFLGDGCVCMCMGMLQLPPCCLWV